MTEYEMASLFFQIVETAHAALANFLTVVFAILVVSYFAASKLDRTVAILLFGIYSIFAIGMTREIFSLYADMARLGFEMGQVYGTDGALTWLGITISGGEGPLWEAPYAVATMCGFAYLASLYFFIRIRKQGGGESQA